MCVTCRQTTYSQTHKHITTHSQTHKHTVKRNHQERKVIKKSKKISNKIELIEPIEDIENLKNDDSNSIDTFPSASKLIDYIECCEKELICVKRLYNYYNVDSLALHNYLNTTTFSLFITERIKDLQRFKTISTICELMSIKCNELNDKCKI